MSFAANIPLNGVSFGQVSTLLMRGFFERKLNPAVVPIAGKVDFNSQETNHAFFDYVNKCVKKANAEHSRDVPSFKLWHLTEGLHSISRVNNLLTFYELDEPTASEINLAKNQDKLIFTNKYSQEVFNQSENKIDLGENIKRVHSKMEEILKPIEWKVYKCLYIDNKSEEETAKLMGYKTNEENRSPGYKQIKNMKRTIVQKVKLNINNGNIDIY